MIIFSREVARRVFAGELRNSNLSFRIGGDGQGDEQQQHAPLYLLTPTGAKCNRVFLAGTLTEKDDIGSDTEYWRGRVVDPTGSVLVYAGQYQLEAAQILAALEPPAFVAVVGKPSLYEAEDGRIILTVRAEAIQKVEEDVRDRWILETARLTIERLKALKATAGPSSDFTTAEHAVSSPDDVLLRARAHYQTDIEQYKEMVGKALSSLKEGKEAAAGGAMPPEKKHPEEKPRGGAPKRNWLELSDEDGAQDVETIDMGKKR